MERYGPERKLSPGPIDLAADIAELARSLARSRSRSLVPSGASFPRCGEHGTHLKTFEFPPIYEATVPREALQILKGDSWKSQAFCRGAGIQLRATSLVSKPESKMKNTMVKDSYPYLMSYPMLNC